MKLWRRVERIEDDAYYLISEHDTLEDAQDAAVNDHNQLRVELIQRHWDFEWPPAEHWQLWQSLTKVDYTFRNPWREHPSGGWWVFIIVATHCVMYRITESDPNEDTLGE